MLHSSATPCTSARTQMEGLHRVLLSLVALMDITRSAVQPGCMWATKTALIKTTLRRPIYKSGDQGPSTRSSATRGSQKEISIGRQELQDGGGRLNRSRGGVMTESILPTSFLMDARRRCLTIQRDTVREKHLQLGQRWQHVKCALWDDLYAVSGQHSET